MNEGADLRSIHYPTDLRPRAILPGAAIWCLLSPVAMLLWHASKAGAGRPVRSLWPDLGIVAVMLACWGLLCFVLRLVATADGSDSNGNGDLFLGFEDATGLQRVDLALVVAPPILGLTLVLVGAAGLPELMLGLVVSLGVLLGARVVDREPARRGTTPPTPTGPAEPVPEPGGVETVTFQWTFARDPYHEGRGLDDSMTIDYLVSHYAAACAEHHALASATDYVTFVQRDMGAREVLAVAAELRERCESQALAPFERIRLVLAFVAGFAWHPREDGTPRYPLEALYERKVGGNCAAVLAGMLLELLGFQPVLFVFRDAGMKRVVVGLAGAMAVPAGLQLIALEGERYYGGEAVCRRAFWDRLPPGASPEERPWAWASLAGPEKLDWALGSVRLDSPGAISVVRLAGSPPPVVAEPRPAAEPPGPGLDPPRAEG